MVARKQHTKKKKTNKSASYWILTLIVAVGVSFITGTKIDRIEQLTNWDTIGQTVEKFLSEESASNPNAVENGTETLPSGLEIPVMSKDLNFPVIKHKAYTLAFNPTYKTPHWVGWELTAQESDGNEEREDQFLPDPKAKGLSAYSSDYSRSGYDRGHMAPAGDMKWNATAMNESFYMTNICPQIHSLNAGKWNSLEKKTRDLAKKYGKVYISCGPIYSSKNPKVIGENRVAVPDAFYKVILIPKATDGKPIAMGFVFQNKKEVRTLISHQLTVDRVEEITGLDFFAALPDDIENQIESVKQKMFP